MTGDDPRRQLGLEVLELLALGPGKGRRTLGAELDGLAQGRVEAITARTDRVGVELHRAALEAVELAGVPQHGVHAVALDDGQHLRHGGDHGGVTLGGGLAAPLAGLDKVVSPLERGQDGRCISHVTTV